MQFSNALQPQGAAHELELEATIHLRFAFAGAPAGSATKQRYNSWTLPSLDLPLTVVPYNGCCYPDRPTPQLTYVPPQQPRQLQDYSTLEFAHQLYTNVTQEGNP